MALARSPFFEDLVVSVGDWSFRLWRGADSTQPIYTSPYAPECYTAGGWVGGGKGGEQEAAGRGGAMGKVRHSRRQWG